MALSPRLGAARTAARTWLRGRLRWRLLAWLLAFSLLPLVISNGVGYYQSQRIIQGQVARYLAELSRAGARHVRDQIERHLLELQMLAAGNAFLGSGALRLEGKPAGVMGQVADSATVVWHLRTKLDHLPSFELLYLQSLTGRVLAATAPVDPALSAQPPVGEPPAFEVAEPAGGGDRFRLTVPLLGPEGQFVAYLVGIVGPSRFGSFLSVAPPLTGPLESVVVNAAGRPIFRSGPQATAAPLPAVVLRARPGAAPLRYRGADGRRMFAVAAEVPGLPWRYIVEVPQEDALGPLRTLGRLSGLAEGLLVLLVAIAAWAVAAGVVAPVGRLVEAARRLGRGDLTARVEAGEQDEIGALQRAFNEMASALAESSARVEELHRRDIARAEQLATVGELASGIAHEVKNPLVGISNGLDLVRRRIGDDPAVAPIMDEMGRQLVRMEGAVRDLLSFARPAQPTLAPLAPERVAARAARLVQPAAEQAGVTLRVDAESELPELAGDEEMLRQALVNLLMNAVQATPAGGEVRLSTALADDALEYRVADSGRGVPPEALPHIFRPFFTTRHSGTGLGLSITHEVVERHGGAIRVETALGRGSTFIVTLPLRHLAAAASRSERE